jgi:hypothetical protein
VERKEISFIGNAMLTRHNLAQSGGEQLSSYTHTQRYSSSSSLLLFLYYFSLIEKREEKTSE